MEESYRDGKPNAPYPGERAPLRGLRSAESLRPMLGPLAFAGLLVPTTLVAQGTPCVSRRAGSVPGAYAATVARERMLVCERLANRIPGVQVAVSVNGKLVWSEGFGYADAARKRPVTRETQFRIGSVSKPLTATAVALLYEQGKLDLDAPVQRYVPSFPDKGHPITTRLLAGHLAGIRHYKDREFFLYMSAQVFRPLGLTHTAPDR